ARPGPGRAATSSWRSARRPRASTRRGGVTGTAGTRRPGCRRRCTRRGSTGSARATAPRGRWPRARSPWGRAAARGCPCAHSTKRTARRQRGPDRAPGKDLGRRTLDLPRPVGHDCFVRRAGLTLLVLLLLLAVPPTARAQTPAAPAAPPAA